MNKSFEAASTPEPLGALGALPDRGTTLPPPPRSCPKADRDVPAKYQNPAVGSSARRGRWEEEERSSAPKLEPGGQDVLCWLVESCGASITAHLLKDVAHLDRHSARPFAEKAMLNQRCFD